MKRHYAEDGAPLACPRCESEAINADIKAHDGGRVSEYAARCGRCNAVVGYWAYGYWARYHSRPGRLRRALAGLWRALRSLVRTTWRHARGRV